MLPCPQLVVGDLHLGPATPAGAEDALVELLGWHQPNELICLGDLFDLSADTSGLPPHASVVGYFERFPQLTRAFRSLLASGRALTLVVGNHDAELGATGVRDAILAHFGLGTTVRFAIEPWWVRRGMLHLEHGHVWDPDNAPIHPLIATRHDNEPLGVALTRRVLAPTGAYQFAHAHQTTPLAGLIRALRELQLQAPEVIVRYFVTGARIFWRAANLHHESTKRAGELAIDDYARAQGVSRATLAKLASIRPTPRHADPAAAFARLYLDRAAATVTALISTAASVARNDFGYLLVAAAGVIYLGCSRGNRAHRYSASLQQRALAAARGIGPLVDATTVVFGHTHVAEASPGYANVGAFGFPTRDGRPYLVFGDDSKLYRGWFGAGREPTTLTEVETTGGIESYRAATS